MMLVSLAALCATWTGSAFGDDVSIDWQKITDMQTDFAIKAANWPQPPLKSADISGHVQLNLFGKKLKMTVSGSEEAGPSRYYRNPLSPPGSKKEGKSELIVDASAGTIGIRGESTFSMGPITANGNYCLVVKAPPRMFELPPKAVFEQAGERFQSMANAEPHTIEGGVVTYRSPPPPPYVTKEHYRFTKAEVQIYPDGVPIKATVNEVCDEACVERHGSPQSGFPSAEVSFSNWQAGAGDVEVFSCPAGSTTDLSAYPHVMHAVTAYDMLLQQLLEHPATRGFAEQFPSIAPLLEEQTRLAAKQQKDTSIWSLLVVSLAAGMSGGAVVLALVAAFARKTRMTEPLLSNA